MPRTAITANLVPLHGSKDILKVDGDAANDHDFDYNSKQILLVVTGAIPTGEIKILGVVDDNGRKADITLTPEANKVYAFNLGKTKLWNQSTGKVNVDLTDDTDIDFHLLELK